MAGTLRRLGWPLVFVAAAIGLWLYAANRPLDVELAEVTRGRIEEYVTEEAVTQLHVERLIKAERAGTLRRIALEEGDRVRAGQVITSIDDTELGLTLDGLDAQLDEINGRLAGVDVPLPKQAEIAAADKERLVAEAQLRTLQEEERAADADLDYARKEFDRVTALLESGTATDREFDRAGSALKVAEAKLKALKHRVEAGELAVETAALRQKVLQESLQDTAYLRQVYAAQKRQVQKTRDLLTYEAEVRSPIDGIVLEKYVDSEGYVQPGTPLLLVGDPESIEIRSDILSDEVGRIRPGQQVLLVGKAIGNPGHRARVKKIYPSGFTKISSLGVRQQRVVVLIEFDNSELGLGPGYELDVKVVVGENDDAVLVPTAAVFATAQGTAVFVVREGRAVLQGVRIGLRGEDQYEVLEGLAAGDDVIVRPPAELEDGGRVRSGGS